VRRSSLKPGKPDEKGAFMLRRRRNQPPASPAAVPDVSAPAHPVADATPGNRYRIAEKLATLGDDFFIEIARGQRAFRVDGKAVRARDTMIFRDMHGNELCKIEEKVARVKESMEIEGPGENRIKLVQKAMFTPSRERFTVHSDGGPDLEVQGDLLSHQYRIRNVATISQK